MQSFFWSVKYISVSCPGKYGPEKTPYLDTFYAVIEYKNIFVSINYCQESRLSNQVAANISLLLAPVDTRKPLAF